MPEDYKVYLGNVPEDARERDVEKFFKGYGHVFNIVLKVIILFQIHGELLTE